MGEITDDNLARTDDHARDEVFGVTTGQSGQHLQDTVRAMLALSIEGM
jgi:hypothetical protein